MAVPTLVASSEPSDVWDGWSRFVPRLNLRDHQLLKELSSGAMAKPLLQAACDQQLVLGAQGDPRRRVVLEPEAWRNQVPRRDRHREFNAMGSKVSLGRRLDPATLRSSSASGLATYVEAFLLAQEVRRSDAAVLPSHLAGGLGEPAREGELRLAEAGATLALREGYRERGDRRKPVLVSATLEASALRSASQAVALARSYSGLPGDGYWIHLAGLTETSAPEVVGLASTFLFALEALSGRRVIAVDCKNLVWALLAAGLSGGCIGIGGREQFDGPTAASTKPRAVQPAVIHPRLLRSFQAKSDNARQAFRAFPCGCGAHVAAEAPVRKPDIRLHALRVRRDMAKASTGANGVTALRGVLTEATWAAADLGLEQPPVASYEAVFAALDWRSSVSL